MTELPKLNKNYDRLASSVLMQWRMIVNSKNVEMHRQLTVHWVLGEGELS